MDTALALYTPSEDQLKLRAAFQCWLEDNPIDQSSFEEKVLAALDKADADRVIKLANMNPQFRRWFISGSIDFRVRLKMLEQKSLNAIESVLLSDDPKSAAARVNAAKYVLEMAGKTPKALPNAAEKLEQAISSMSEAELKMLMEDADGNETTVEIKKSKGKRGKVIDVEAN